VAERLNALVLKTSKG